MSQLAEKEIILVFDVEVLLVVLPCRAEATYLLANNTADMGLVLPVQV